MWYEKGEQSSKHRKHEYGTEHDGISKIWKEICAQRPFCNINLAGGEKSDNTILLSIQAA